MEEKEQSKDGKEVETKQNKEYKFSIRNILSWIAVSDIKSTTISQDIMRGIAIIISTLTVTVGLIILFNQVFSSLYISIVGGLLFGFITLIVNKTIIKNLKSKASPRQLTIFTILIPLLILLLESLLISLPIKLELFDKEIDKQISLHKLEEINMRYLSTKPFSKIPKLEKESDSLLAELKKLNNLLKQELDENRKSGILGKSETTLLFENKIDKIEIKLSRNEFLQDSIEVSLKNSIKDEFDNYSLSIIEKYLLIESQNSDKNIGLVSSIVVFLCAIIVFLPFIMSVRFISLVNFIPIREFIDIDKEIKESKKIVNEYISNNKEEGVVKEVYEKEKKKLNNKIEALKKELNTKNKIENRTFQSYFDSMIDSFQTEIDRSNEKASMLLTRGIRISIFGIFLYLSAIIIFQYIFTIDKLQNYHIIGIISCSLLFIFLQFVGAWFLKQYRYFVDTSTYFMKLKTNIDRYTLMLLAINDFKGNEESKKELFDKLVDFLGKDIKYPESYILKNPDVNLAKEAFDSATSTLNETIKTLNNQK